MRRRLASAFSIDAALAIWALAVLVFLFAPIVTAVAYSFNEGVLGRQSVAFTSVTTHWYRVAWQNGELRSALGVSLRVAAASSIIATILGTLAGFVLARRTGVARGALEALVYLLLVVPEIVLGVALLLFFTRVGVPLGTLTLIAAHSPFMIAVIALVVRSRVLAIDRATEEASADLGAGPWRTFFGVTLPQARPAILAGMILAFTFSFDDLVISYFLTTPTVATLPVYLFATIRFGVRPDVNVVATFMLAFTLTLLSLSGLVYWWQSRRVGTPTTINASLGPLDAGFGEHVT